MEEENTLPPSGSNEDGKKINRDKFDDDASFEEFQAMLSHYKKDAQLSGALGELDDFQKKLSIFQKWVHGAFARDDIGEYGTNPGLPDSEYYDPEKLGTVQKVPEEILQEIGHGVNSGIHLTVSKQAMRPILLYLN